MFLVSNRTLIDLKMDTYIKVHYSTRGIKLYILIRDHQAVWKIRICGGQNMFHKVYYNKINSNNNINDNYNYNNNSNIKVYYDIISLESA